MVLAGAVLGCGASTPRRPVGLPPTPGSVTAQNPGGDAANPELAALERLEREPWGLQRDRFNTVLVPLPDARTWKHVTLWGIPTRAAFRFGDEHYGVVGVWYEATTERSDPQSCLERFVASRRKLVEASGFRVVVAPVASGAQAIRSGPVGGPALDASSDSPLWTRAYAGALASLPSWPGSCLIEGFMVAAGKHRELAARVRDRSVAEGATHSIWQSRVMRAPGLGDQ